MRNSRMVGRRSESLPAEAIDDKSQRMWRGVTDNEFDNTARPARGV